MGYSIRIEPRGDDEFIARFKKFGATLLVLDDAMNKSGKYLSKFFSGEVFASRGRIIGHPWQPLNSKYAGWKARKFPGRPPLIRSGAMQRGFEFDATSHSVSLFNDRFYFRFHQNGEGVPQRVMMDLDSVRQEVVGGYIGDNILKNMEKAGV